MFSYEKYILVVKVYISRVGKYFMGFYGIKIDKIIKIVMFLRDVKLFL